MRPFQEFRYWAKRAPGSERTATGVAAVIVLALLAWLVVPEDDGGTEEVSAFDSAVAGDGTQAGVSGDGGSTDVSGDGGSGTTGGTATVSGDSTAGASGGSGGSGGTGGSTAGGGTSTASGDGEGCQSPAGKMKGVTDKEVKVVVGLTEIVGPAANQIFDIPTPEEAKEDFEAVINGINGEGGVACRKLVAEYITVNPTDEQGMLQRCREVASKDVAAIIDTGSLATKPSALACFGQSKVLYFGAFYITDTLRRQFFPYLYSTYYKEQVYKDTAFMLKELGFFAGDKGFKKLGFIYRDCEKEAIAAFRGWLKEAGVTDDMTVAYNLGCPAVFASESDMAQATLTFQRAGVSHVIGANVQGDIARITAHNEQQNFRPKWGLPDEAMLSIASGSRAPNPDNFADALAVTLARDAEQQTPGMTPTAGTQKCNAYRKAAGLPPVWDVPANAGNACSQLWMFDGALSNAPEFSPGGVQAGLQRTKALDFSFPQGIADFSAPGTTTGGQHFRVAQYHRDCSCWRVLVREFRRGF